MERAARVIIAIFVIHTVWTVNVNALPADLSVSGTTPNIGTTVGGCPVAVSGMGFQSGASLTIGGKVPNQISVASDTLITAVTPRAHGVAPVGSPPSVQEVVVANPDGGSASGQLFTYVRPGDIRAVVDGQTVYGAHDGNVSIGETIYILNVLLEASGFEVKPEVDSNCNGVISIGEVIQAVHSLLRVW